MDLLANLKVVFENHTIPNKTKKAAMINLRLRRSPSPFTPDQTKKTIQDNITSHVSIQPTALAMYLNPKNKPRQMRMKIKMEATKLPNFIPTPHLKPSLKDILVLLLTS